MDQPCSVLGPTFYQRSTAEVAQALLGKTLISELGGRRVTGLIVETEAYLPENDSACHAAKHRTARTEVMFGPAGFAYVYPIHARHCFNVVTETVERGCAVLIRAVEPLSGIDTMVSRRGLDNPRRLATGPACLCESFGIGRQLSGHDLTRGESIWISQSAGGKNYRPHCSSVRIGVTSAKEKRLRYYVPDNPFVSDPKRLRT